MHTVGKGTTNGGSVGNLEPGNPASTSTIRSGDCLVLNQGQLPTCGSKFNNPAVQVLRTQDYINKLQSEGYTTEQIVNKLEYWKPIDDALGGYDPIVLNSMIYGNDPEALKSALIDLALNKLAGKVVGTVTNKVTGSKGSSGVSTKPAGASGEKGVTGTTSNGYKVSNGADTTIAKNELEHPATQSRINVQNGNNKIGWNHVIDRHFSDKNASQFTISQSELKTILQSKEVSKVPISRVIDSADGPRYERVITFDKNIGVDKFSKGPTNTMTILTDKKGNLITTTPGRIK